MMESRTLHVDTLRLRTARRGTASGLQQAVAPWLGTADVHPPGLAPSAVLVVRALPDPMPQRCGPLVPGSRPPPEWVQAVRQRLGAIAHRAARPVDGRVPPHAEAVHFADRAEWAACLALDLAAGAAPSRWWWRAFLRSAAPLDRSARVATVLTAAPSAIPAVWAHLTAWRRVRVVLQVLSPEQAALVMERMASAFGLPLPAADAPSQASGRPAPSPRAHAEPRSASQHPPWEAAIQAAIPPDVPSPVHAALVGAGLTLHRHPSVASRPSFAAALQRWKRDAAAPKDPGADAASAAPTPAELPAALVSAEASGRAPDAQKGPVGERNAPRADAASAAPEASAAQHTPGASLARADGPRPISPATAPRGRNEAEPPTAPPALSFKEPTHPSIESLRRSSTVQSTGPQGGARRSSAPTDANPSADGPDATWEPGPTEAPVPPSRSDGETETRSAEDPPTDRPAAPSPGPDDAVGPPLPADAFAFRVEPVTLATELGGVLYLINVMEQLQLPGCFESSDRLASTAGPWGVLEALGRSLLGAEGERFQDDPLWTALARLDGRAPDTLAGEGFPMPPAFVCPPRWVEEGGGLDAPLRWRVAGDRVRVWTANYLLADCPRHGDNPVAVAGNVARNVGLHPSALRVADAPDPWRDWPGPPQVAPSLSAWTAWVTPFVRYRLTAALDGPLDASLTAALFAVPGVLHLSAMHVDWTAPLDAVSLPVRLAGLDRDPGWVPAFGRVVLFHFD